MANFIRLFFTCISAFIFLDVATSNLIDINIDHNSNPDDVGFYLLPNSNDINDVDELMYMNPGSIRNSRYNSTYPVILHVHGFTHNYKSELSQYVHKAYLDAGYVGKVNIIAVDWGKLSGRSNSTRLIVGSELAKLPAYVQAVKNVYVVGKRLKEFIVFLIENEFLSGPEKIHLVGQSLGAHVSGMAGYYFEQETHTMIGRITGTDPAGPLFQFAHRDRRLDETDASFIDVVHTNGGILGYLGELGDVDFFVNGLSPFQPECFSNLTDFTCSHFIAARYFAKSIRDNSIEANCLFPTILGYSYCWPLKTIFGEHCPTTGSLRPRGSYVLHLRL